MGCGDRFRALVDVFSYLNLLDHDISVNLRFLEVNQVEILVLLGFL